MSPLGSVSWRNESLFMQQPLAFRLYSILLDYSRYLRALIGVAVLVLIGVVELVLIGEGNYT